MNVKNDTDDQFESRHAVSKPIFFSDLSWFYSDSELFKKPKKIDTKRKFEIKTFVVTRRPFLLIGSYQIA